MKLNLDGLEAASRDALMLEWREVIGCLLPKQLSKSLMVQIPSHAYQMGSFGGYNKRLDSQLKSATWRDTLRPVFKPGRRFVRDYQGVPHVVDVANDGRIIWKDQIFKSLSHTERAITGYNVSGFKCLMTVLGKHVVRADVYSVNRIR